MKRRRFLASASLAQCRLPRRMLAIARSPAPRVGYLQVGPTGDAIRDELRIGMRELLVHQKTLADLGLTVPPSLAPLITGWVG